MNYSICHILKHWRNPCVLRPSQQDYCDRWTHDTPLARLRSVAAHRARGLNVSSVLFQHEFLSHRGPAPVDIPKRALSWTRGLRISSKAGQIPRLRKATRYNWSAQVSRDSCRCHLADEVEDVVLTSKGFKSGATQYTYCYAHPLRMAQRYLSKKPKGAK
jgi:hypothetical protein